MVSREDAKTFWDSLGWANIEPEAYPRRYLGPSLRKQVAQTIAAKVSHGWFGPLNENRSLDAFLIRAGSKE